MPAVTPEPWEPGWVPEPDPQRVPVEWLRELASYTVVEDSTFELPWADD